MTLGAKFAAHRQARAREFSGDQGSQGEQKKPGANGSSIFPVVRIALPSARMPRESAVFVFLPPALPFQRFDSVTNRTAHLRSLLWTPFWTGPNLCKSLSSNSLQGARRPRVGHFSNYRRLMRSLLPCRYAWMTFCRERFSAMQSTAAALAVFYAFEQRAGTLAPQGGERLGKAGKG